MTLVVVLTARPASAQTAAQMAARRDLLEQARSAAAAGQHDQALDLAQRAGGIHMTPSLRMFIATEENALGRLAQALGDAEVCVVEATRDLSMQARDAVITTCRDLATALRPRVAHVTINVPTPRPDGLRVTVAGEVLDPNLYGVSSVVTPGTVVVEASAPGHVASRQEVTVAAGATEAVTITLAAEATRTTEPPTISSSAPSAAPPVARVTVHPETRPAEMGAPAFAAIGVGVLGLVSVGVGAALYVDTGNTFSRCQMSAVGCGPNMQPRGEELAGIVMMYAGAALAAGGTVAFVVMRMRGRHEEPSRATSLWVDPRGAVGIVGRF